MTLIKKVRNKHWKRVIIWNFFWNIINLDGPY